MLMETICLEMGGCGKENITVLSLELVRVGNFDAVLLTRDYLLPQI